MSPTFSQQGKHRPANRRAILRVEQLEDRSLLSTGYGFTPVAVIGNAAPGGGQFFFDFEIGGLNSKGQVVFTADLTPDGVNDIGEGVFLGGKGGLSQIVRVGQSAPGGGTFGGSGTYSPDTINDAGDAAFGFALSSDVPIDVNGGVYRYDHNSGKVTGVLVPFVTPVPGGGGATFQGSQFHPELNNRGDLVFPGVVPATIGPGASIGLGVGIFEANKHGHLTKVVAPGDAAPGGSVFDFAQNPSINNRGDVAFGAHIAADPRIGLGQDLPAIIFSAESVYFRDGKTGAIQSIAHQGAAIPTSAGGGTFDYAYSPVLNSRGDILFDAGLKGTSTGVVIGGLPVDSQAIFLWSHGKLISIARQGDSMPGGGKLVSASFNPGNYALNERGDVAFNALLDNGKEGVFLWSHGSLTLVAETGTVIPGVGTIASLDEYGTGLPNSWVAFNDRGQVAFSAVLTNGGVDLLLATPRDTEDGGRGDRNVAAGHSKEKGHSDGPAFAAPATVATTASANPSEVAAWLALGGHSTSGLGAANAPSQPANSGSTLGERRVVVLPQHTKTSLTTAPSSSAKTHATSAVDRVFGAFRDGLPDDSLT
jgi:hypothetical protein